MLCAYEMIEYFYSVANRIVEEKKKANTRIDLYRGSLPTTS